MTTVCELAKIQGKKMLWKVLKRKSKSQHWMQDSLLKKMHELPDCPQTCISAGAIPAFLDPNLVPTKPLLMTLNITASSGSTAYNVTEYTELLQATIRFTSFSVWTISYTLFKMLVLNHYLQILITVAQNTDWFQVHN